MSSDHNPGGQMNNKTLSTIGVIIGIILLGAFPTWADFDEGESA